MTVYEFASALSDDMSIVIQKEDGEILFDGIAMDVFDYYMLTETEISSCVTIWENKLYISVNPDDDLMDEIREELNNG